MQFVWGGVRAEANRELTFTYRSEEPFDGLTLCAADFYRVWADGEFISYGPERTAAGYARLRRLSLSGVRELVVKVTAYNVACYACDQQLPYFGAEVTRGGRTIAETSDFVCESVSDRRRDVPRYSFQRGFLEVYDLRRPARETLPVYSVEAPILLEGNGDKADYAEAGFRFLGETSFGGFDEVREVWWKDNPLYRTPEGAFDIQRDLIGETETGYLAADYELPSERSGFLRLVVETDAEVKIFAVFDEILPDGKWIFRRSANNDFICWTLPAGRHEVMSAEPYAFKYLKILSPGKAKIVPSLVTLENGSADCISVEGDARVKAVFEAAAATFRQNAVDIFTDCPGRERAGWLCDSYFSAQAERLFTGRNEIEKRFLENYILADVPEIEKGMLPDCFPAQHHDHAYIPNWAMWFVLELYDYFLRTSDREIVERAKEKVYGVVDFFTPFLNEYGLLENLRGWIFLEWSVSNDAAYVSGVNFPSNMLYALMLETVDKLYGDPELSEQARRVRGQILRLSYDGKFFADNALRQEGELVRCADHVSETCQYYALFAGMETDTEFRRKMMEEFGPLRADAYPEVGRSNMFIGNYLRFFWLCGIGERERVIRESLDYFSDMAEKTGTLWENDSPSASCNHGFASVAAVLLLRCLTGYETVENGAPVFDKNFTFPKKYGVKVTFSYPDGERLAMDC